MLRYPPYIPKNTIPALFQEQQTWTGSATPDTNQHRHMDMNTGIH